MYLKKKVGYDGTKDEITVQVSDTTMLKTVPGVGTKIINIVFKP